jgi:hypothetical protein
LSEFFPAFKHNEKPEFGEICKDVRERFKVFDNIPDIDYVFNYPLLQTAQEIDLVKNYGVGGQIGWDMSKKIGAEMNFEQLVSALQNKRLSEKFFIDLLKNLYPEINLDVQYIQAALCFLTENQQAPYNITKGVRPKINERFSKFCSGAKGLKGYTAALERIDKNIVSRFENLFGEIPSSKQNKQDRTIEKIDEIQNLVLLGELK